MDKYKEIANEARLKVLDLIYKAQTSHIGSNFSCIDIMAVVFEKIDLDKDKFVLSKGWVAAALYYFLNKKDRITDEQLDSYCMEGSEWIGLAEPIHPDIPFAGGSMGMGMPSAVGYALSKKLKKEPGIVYCLMSDGEIQIGTFWESLLLAAQHKLDNLVVLVDSNNLQAMGETKDILDISNVPPAVDKLGWDVDHINGHDYDEIETYISNDLRKPKIIFCDTVKGKGVSFMENVNMWHYKAPNEDEYNKAKAELCQK